MPHISSKKIDPKIKTKLFKQLSCVSVVRNEKEAQRFLEALLTETEQLMFSKRIAAVIMLSQGYSQYAIENSLELSSSTIARLRNEYITGKYEQICLSFSKQKKEKEEFWETIEVLLRLGMPSQTGDRWKFLRNSK